MDAVDNPHLVNYEQKINQIWTHPFVTSDSIESRNKALKAVEDYKTILRGQGITDVFSIAFGSVGAGMALKEESSDIDMRLVIVSSNPQVKDAVLRIFQESQLQQKDFKHELEVWPIDVNLTGIKKDFRDFLAFDREEKLIMRYADMFHHTLGEDVDPEEKKLVNNLRKQILETIHSLPPKDSQIIWNAIRERIKRQYVLYEKSTGGDTLKRQKRVNKIFDQKIAERFPGNIETQDRAKSTINTWRQNWNLPELEEMYLAFDINKHE